MNFFNTTVIPDARIVQRVLNTQLLNDKGYTLYFEPKKLEAFQQAELQTAEKVSVLTGNRAVLSRRQAGEMLGITYLPADLEELDRIDRAKETQQTQQPMRNVDSDIVAWRRKVNRKGRDVDFSPDYLTEYEESVIRERLANKHISVQDCFEKPFVGF